MRPPYVRFAKKFKTTPKVYGKIQRMRHWYEMPIVDILDWLNKKGVKINYHQLYYWLNLKLVNQKGRGVGKGKIAIKSPPSCLKKNRRLTRRTKD